MNLISTTSWMQGMIRLCDDGFHQNWHERNGGNCSYRIRKEEIEEVFSYLNLQSEWQPIKASVPELAGEFFLVTGSGQFMRNVALAPEENLCITVR